MIRNDCRAAAADLRAQVTSDRAVVDCARRAAVFRARLEIDAHFSVVDDVHLRAFSSSHAIEAVGKLAVVFKREYAALGCAADADMGIAFVD